MDAASDRAYDDALDSLAGALRDRLLLEAGRGGDGDGDLHERIRALVDREAGLLDDDARARLATRIAERSFGLGPLEPLLGDPVRRRGDGQRARARCGSSATAGSSRPAVRFDSEADLRHAIERILAPLGRRVDEAEPLCDARLPDGSRVNVVVAPLALDGPVLTIRRFRPRGFGPDDLVANGTWAAPLRDLLQCAVRARCNVLISGGTGSGKTTTLNALTEFIGDGERIVTVEDAAELRLRHAHVVRLEARPASLEGRGEVTVRRLVRNALRMRPDRIVVGEVRGAEALDMLSAMSSGHDGSLSTVHAGSPEEALRRVETLALMAGLGLPHEAIREQVAGRAGPRRPPGADVRRHAPRRRRQRGRARRRRARPRASSTRCATGARRGARRSATRSPRGWRRRNRSRGPREPRRRCSPVSPARAPLLAAWEAIAAAEQERVAAVGAALVRAGARRPALRARADEPERRRLVALGTLSLLGAGWLVAGPWAGARARRRRRRGRRARSCAIRAAPPRRGGGGGGAGDRPCARRRARRRALGARRAERRRARRRHRRSGGEEMRRVAAALDARRAHRGRAAARSRGARARGPLDTLVAAVLLQRDAGGDLAALLRDLAAALEERGRVVADARSATAQARFTALLVTGAAGRGPRARRARPAGLRSLALVSEPLTAVMVARRARAAGASRSSASADRAGGGRRRERGGRCSRSRPAVSAAAAIAELLTAPPRRPRAPATAEQPPPIGHLAG